IHRAHFKSANSVLIEGGDENDCGQIRVADGFDNFKTIEFRHLHVEKDEIRTFRKNALNGFFSVATFADHLNVMMLLEQRPDAFARQWFVVDDQSTNHGATP